jgi:hypothetical protein
MITIGYIALCVVQAGLFVFCLYRCLSLGRAYERELSEKYPAAAAKRHAHPFYFMTFPGMLLPGQMTEDGEPQDASLHRKRMAVYYYFAAAVIIVCVPQLLALGAGIKPG